MPRRHGSPEMVRWADSPQCECYEHLHLCLLILSYISGTGWRPWLALVTHKSYNPSITHNDGRKLVRSMCGTGNADRPSSAATAHYNRVDWQFATVRRSPKRVWWPELHFQHASHKTHKFNIASMPDTRSRHNMSLLIRKTWPFTKANIMYYGKSTPRTPDPCVTWRSRMTLE